ncbi:hypothetical protein [Bosea sp. AS-1]|uniref:hypothetical protein n=1 Tax=Bosea sp. AS-1 TaxID=2015316 RepID=UPI0012FDED4F|nr:hypothetical protein [Bosea sp. AS-1]
MPNILRMLDCELPFSLHRLCPKNGSHFSDRRTGMTDPASEEERITGAEKATRPREEPRDERAYDGKPASSQFRTGRKPNSAPMAVMTIMTIIMVARTVLVPAIVMAAIPDVMPARPVAVNGVMSVAPVPAMGLCLRFGTRSETGEREADRKRTQQ